ncbi:MAG: hypothetical protein WCJ07_00055 [Verrucomicrobiota bacterium]
MTAFNNIRLGHWLIAERLSYYAQQDFAGKFTGKNRNMKTTLALIFLLLALAVTRASAASALQPSVSSASDAENISAAALSENAIIGLPEPVGLSLIIFAAMLLALVGLNRAWSKPSTPAAASSGSGTTLPSGEGCRRGREPQNACAPPAADTLLARFCQKYNCSSMDFSERVLWQCLKPQARPWAFLLRGRSGRFFAVDLELIHQVENLSNLRKIEEEVNDFSHYDKFRPRTFAASFFQHTLGMRLSSRRLVILCRNLFT